jgi:hypothetical protein
MVGVGVNVGVILGVGVGVGLIGYAPSFTNDTLPLNASAISYVPSINQIFLVSFGFRLT